MPEWQITFHDGTFDNYNADSMKIGKGGAIIFYDAEGHLYPQKARCYGPTSWKMIERVDRGPEQIND